MYGTYSYHTGWCNLVKEELMLDITKIHKLFSSLEDGDFSSLTSRISRCTSAEVLHRFFFPSSTIRCGNTDFVCRTVGRYVGQYLHKEIR